MDIRQSLFSFINRSIAVISGVATQGVYDTVLVSDVKIRKEAVSKPRTGAISLKPLYAFAEKHKENKEALRLERTKLGKDYCAECDDLVNNIPDAKGFYLWGFFDHRRSWHSIYLGKAGFGKTKKNNLKKRIREELVDERAFLWRAFFNEKRLLQIRDKIHPHRRYTWYRPILKAGTTHILWVSVQFPDRSIKSIEGDLIEALNPSANIQRPTPPEKVQHEATDTFSKFRSLIHTTRQTRNGILTPRRVKALLRELRETA